MLNQRVPTPRSGIRRRALAPLFVIAFIVGGSVAGCSNHDVDPGGAAGAAATGAAVAPTAANTAATAPATTAATNAPATPAAQVPMGAMRMPTADEVTTAWAARPAFVETLPAEGRSAYAFALARPDVLQWIPCYCGCGGMGHRHNLDCFFKRRETGAFTFEEHASFCDICVKTANLASQMVQDGRTIGEIRAAVDATFGGGAAPGTDTALPPS